MNWRSLLSLWSKQKLKLLLHDGFTLLAFSSKQNLRSRLCKEFRIYSGECDKREFTWSRATSSTEVTGRIWLRSVSLYDGSTDAALQWDCTRSREQWEKELGALVGQTHTKVHISISTNFGRFIANGLINQSLLRKRLTALALCKSGLCYS